MKSNALLRAGCLLLVFFLCAMPLGAAAEEPLQMTGFDCDAGEHPALYEPITWTITATGGSGEKVYSLAVYWGTDVYSEDFMGLLLYYSRPYGAARSFTFTPNREGVYFVHGSVRDAAGTVRTYISRNVVMPAPRVLSVEADREICAVGERIRWTAEAEGGTGYTRTAQFVVQRDGAYVTAGEREELAYGDNECVFDYTPDLPGEYRVVFYYNAHTEMDTMTSGSVTVASPLAFTSFTPDHYRVLPGNRVTWTAQTTGGHDVLYSFWLFHDGELIQEFDDVSVPSFSAELTERGAYTACCVASDALDSVPISSEDVYAGDYFLMPPGILGIFPSRERAAPGARITWRVLVRGGSGERAYDYTLLKDGVSVATLEGQTNNTFTYTLEEAGTYRLRVRVTDGSSTPEAEGGEVNVDTRYLGMFGGPAVFNFMFWHPDVQPTEQHMLATPTPTPRPTAKPTRTPQKTVTPIPPTPVPLTLPPVFFTMAPFVPPLRVTAHADTSYGEVHRAVTVKAAAEGGTGIYEYAFRVYLGGIAQGAASAYSDSVLFTFTPKKPGNYRVLAIVRDGEDKASAYTGNIHIK